MRIPFYALLFLFLNCFAEEAKVEDPPVILNEEEEIAFRDRDNLKDTLYDENERMLRRQDREERFGEYNYPDTDTNQDLEKERSIYDTNDR